MKGVINYLVLILLLFGTNISVHATTYASRGDFPTSRSRNNRYEKYALHERGGTVALAKAATMGPIQSFFSVIYNARQQLIAAGIARSISIFGMYPVDTVKVR